MTDTINDHVDPIAAQAAAGASEASLRDYGAALVRSGLDPQSVNDALRAAGAKPLDMGSAEYARALATNMLRDERTVSAILAGDAEALTELSLLELHARGRDGTKLANSDPRAEEYLPHALNAALAFPDIQTTEEYARDLSSIAADLKMDAASAKSFAENHLEAARRWNASTQEQREAYGTQQEADFLAVVGGDAEAQIMQANATLSAMRSNGAKMDLRQIARSNGALVALQLIHIAQCLA